MTDTRPFCGECVASSKGVCDRHWQAQPDAILVERTCPACGRRVRGIHVCENAKAICPECGVEFTGLHSCVSRASEINGFTLENRLAWLENAVLVLLDPGVDVDTEELSKRLRERIAGARRG